MALTPEQRQRVLDRWQRISRLGLVPFTLLTGGAIFLFLSLFDFLYTWLALRAHHLSYPWPSELNLESLTLRGVLFFGACAILLFFGACAIPLAYWLAIKRTAIRCQ